MKIYEFWEEDSCECRYFATKEGALKAGINWLCESRQDDKVADAILQLVNEGEVFIPDSPFNSSFCHIYEIEVEE